MNPRHPVTLARIAASLREEARRSQSDAIRTRLLAHAVRLDNIADEMTAPVGAFWPHRGAAAAPFSGPTPTTTTTAPPELGEMLSTSANGDLAAP